MNSLSGICDWYKFKVLSNEMGLTKSGATFGDTQSTLLVAMLQYVFTLVNVGNGAEKMLEMAQ